MILLALLYTIHGADHLITYNPKNTGAAFHLGNGRRDALKASVGLIPAVAKIEFFDYPQPHYYTSTDGLKIYSIKRESNVNKVSTYIVQQAGTTVGNIEIDTRRHMFKATISSQRLPRLLGGRERVHFEHPLVEFAIPGRPLTFDIIDDQDAVVANVETHFSLWDHWANRGVCPEIGPDMVNIALALRKRLIVRDIVAECEDGLHDRTGLKLHFSRHDPNARDSLFPTRRHSAPDLTRLHSFNNHATLIRIRDLTTDELDELLDSLVTSNEIPAHHLERKEDKINLLCDYVKSQDERGQVPLEIFYAMVSR